jgi:competence ComEA-like helix-hairpin-helix protein
MDPLSELVKIEPKHLGVGMYQHDVDEKSLNSTLNSIVSECVSYVGVDVNCASESLLKSIAGLSEKKAQVIIEHRKKIGAFKSREELKKVKSIGPVTFTQMAGFLRINKSTAKCSKINLLDSTNVHPESYELAEKILTLNNLKIENFGSEKFIEKIRKFSAENSIESLCKKFNENSENVQNVLNIFKSEKFLHDIRDEKKLLPDFKQSIKSVESLKRNQIVSGVVRNIVDFGAFIDIGVQQDGLLHVSKYRNVRLKLGDRVELRIEKVEQGGKRIGLELIKVL